MRIFRSAFTDRESCSLEFCGHCPGTLLCFSIYCVTLGDWDAHTKGEAAPSSSGKIPGICESRGAVLPLLQVNHVSLGKSPRFHWPLECSALKMDNFRVSCYIDSGVRRELMKPFMHLGLSGLKNSFLLIFIVLIVSLKRCASSAVDSEREAEAV